MNRLHFLRVIAGTSLALVALTTVAHSFKLGEIDIDHPYARPTREGQLVAGGYLKLANKGAADRLLSARAPVADTTEIHSMTMEGNVMKMRQVDAIELPAGRTVELKPGGYHLMLMGLKAPLKAGDQFPLTLKFEKAGEVAVTVKVEEPKPQPNAAAGHAH